MLFRSAEYLATLLTDENARILDIGCATGGLIKWLNNLGFKQTSGIDPSEDCVRLTKESTGKDAWKGSLNSIPQGIGKFDLVILSHVVEHVQDVASVVKTLKDLVSPTGLVYIEVPNAAKYQDFIIAPFQDFNTEHINHFSIQSLLNLFRSGWSLTETGEKLLKIQADLFYPAAYIVAQHNEAAPARILKMDSQLRLSIESYIKLSRSMIERIDAQIRSLLEGGKNIIVYGTGQLAMKLLKDTCLSKANIEFFVDANPLNQGKLLQGKPIHSPSKILESNAPILVASLVNAESIRSDIREMSCPNPVVLLNS